MFVSSTGSNRRYHGHGHGHGPLDYGGPGHGNQIGFEGYDYPKPRPSDGKQNYII